MASKWTSLNNDIISVIEANKEISNHLCAQTLLNTKESKNENTDVHSLSTYIRRNRAELLDRNEGIYDATEELDVPNSKVKHLWLKNKSASLFVKNPNYKDNEETDYEALRTSLLKEIKGYAPHIDKIERVYNVDEHLLIVDPADIHIGKLCSSFETGEKYNSQIAVKRVKEGVHGLIHKARSWNIGKIIFVGGNDILHVDNPKSTTTSGTHQDVDGMWYDNFVIAKKLYIDILTTLMQVADVHFTYNPSNHDFSNGFFLCQAIEAYFSNCKNITFSIDMSHRKYSVYGSNLIGTTHGDGAKVTDLPLLMAHESPEWSTCKHRYIYTHHIHHKMSKDYMSVCVESLRSPSGTDGWHHRKGYQHSPKAIEAFIHHKEHGQVAKLIHLF